MLGDSNQRSLHTRNAPMEYPSRTSKYRGRENEVSVGPVAPISAPKSNFTFSLVPTEQKENIINTPDKIHYPTPGSSAGLVCESPSSGIKRKLTDTEFADFNTESHLFKRTRPACERVKPDNFPNEQGIGSLSGLKAVLNDMKSLNPTECRPMAAARKPKTRKQQPASQVTDPPTPQGFAQFMMNPTNTTNPTDTAPIDPLLCTESIVEPEGLSGAIPTPVEHDVRKVMTPLAYPSTGPSGIATPTRSYLPKNVVDFDKVSENLRKIASTSNFGLMIQSDPVLALKTAIPAEDLPLFDSSFSIWINDVKAEDNLAQKISPECLERHHDITALSRWVVLNWIREVCVEQRISRQSFQAAVQLLDNFLSNFDFDQDSFQLVAVTALCIALKIHETTQYPIAMLVEFVWDDDSFTTQENQANVNYAKCFLLKYEFKMMKLMNWNVMTPNPLDFLRHSLQYAALFEGSLYMCELPGGLFDSRYDRGSDTVLHQKYDTMMFARAATILDRAVMDIYSLNFLGSQIAAAIFWMIYPRRGSDDYAEKVLLIATGYKLEQLTDCLEFLAPYGNVTDETIMEILQGDAMSESFQKNSADGAEFKLEEHQIPGVLMPADYDNILADRAKKAGKPHVLSYWQYQ